MANTNHISLTVEELQSIKLQLALAQYRGAYFRIITSPSEITLRDSDDFLLGRIKREKNVTDYMTLKTTGNANQL